MVSNMRRDVWTLAISLLLAVISLDGSAMGATAPVVRSLARMTPSVPFKGAPGKMAQDTAGNIYVADFWAKSIVKFDRAGNRLSSIPLAARPVGIAVQGNGDLVVSFQGPLYYVAIHSQAGSELKRLGAGVGEFYKPSGVAIDARGYIYVLDTGDFYGSGKTCVKVYDVDGNAVSTGVNVAGYPANSFGSDGPINAPSTGTQFVDPVGIAYDKAGKQIVVVDTFNGRFKFFNDQSNATAPFAFVRSLGSRGSSAMAFSSPQDVAFEYVLDANGNPTAINRMFVLEKAKQKVVVIDPAGTGTELGTIDATTVSGGSMRTPMGMVYDQSQKALWVSSATDKTSQSNLAAFGIDKPTTEAWPPPPLFISINEDALPHNTTATPLLVGGSVDAGATVSCTNTWANALQGTYVCGVNGNSWSCSIPLLDGNGGNYLLCTAAKAGFANSSVAPAHPVYKSVTPGPVVTATITPFNPNIINTKNVQVCGTAEAGATIELRNQANGGYYTAPVVAGSWCVSNVLLAENDNTLQATAWVPFRTDTIVSTLVKADTTVPDLSQIVFALNGGTVKEPIQNVTGIVADINPDKVFVSLNGSAVPTDGLQTKATLDASHMIYSAPVLLAHGLNTLVVSASDKAGNISSITRTLNLDTDFPVSALLSAPADNSYQTANGTIVTGSVSSLPATVTVFGTEATINADKTWSVDLPSIQSGLHDYPVEITSGTQTAVQKLAILKNSDSLSPYAVDLAINVPRADQTVKSPNGQAPFGQFSIPVSGKASAGATKLEAGIDGGVFTDITATGYNAVTGDFTFQVNVNDADNSEVTHVAAVRVTLADGRTATAFRSIIVDTKIPNFSIVAQSDPAPLALSGNVDPSAIITAQAFNGAQPVTVTITYDDYDATNGTVWHASLPSTYDSLAFTVTDAAGNSTPVRPYVAGIPNGDVDADGVVRLADAMLVLRFVANTQTPTPAEFARADVGPALNGKAAPNGQVDIFDALMILRKALGLENW